MAKKTRAAPKKKKKSCDASVADEVDATPAAKSEEIAASLAAGLRADAAAHITPSATLSSAARGELPELLSTLRQLRQKLGGLKLAGDAALERFSPPSGAAVEDSGSLTAYIEMKVQVLLSYVTSLVYYLALKAQGCPVREHPVVLRLMWARTLLEKLRPVDQRLQYQLNRALQWADQAAATNGATVGSAHTDRHALRPGELATSVEDEPDDGDAFAPEVGAGDEDGVYRPPKIGPVEYTGDHVTAAERAEKDLERKRARLERSEFARTLREEFTDAPMEVHAQLKSAAAQMAARKLAEQEEYEVDNMMRVRSSKKDKREQKRLLRQTHIDAGGSTLDDAADFRDLSAGLEAESRRQGKGGKSGRGRRSSGGVLQEFQDAVGRARRARGVVDSTLSGDLPSGLGGGKRKGGGRGGGRGKRRKM